MFKSFSCCLYVVPWVLLLGLLPAVLQARTWTDAATRRTIEGDFVAVDGAKVVIKLDAGKTVRVSIARLIDADKVFIREQSAASAAKRNEAPGGERKEAGAKTGPLTRLTCPVSVKAHPIKGKGEEREGGLEVTNNGNRNVSTLVLNMYYLRGDGKVGKSVPHTSSGTFDGPKGVLGQGKSHLIGVNSFFMEDETVSVDGEVTRVEWDDGTHWPTWTGPVPEREGDAPVVVKMIGILGEGEMIEPVVAVFNTGSKGVKNVNYGIVYLDAEGQVLGRAGYGYSRAGNWLPGGKGTAICGASSGPPEGTVDAKVTIRQVSFDDDTLWTPSK